MGRGRAEVAGCGFSELNHGFSSDGEQADGGALFRRRFRRGRRELGGAVQRNGKTVERGRGGKARGSPGRGRTAGSYRRRWRRASVAGEETGTPAAMRCSRGLGKETKRTRERRGVGSERRRG